MGFCFSPVRVWSFKFFNLGQDLRDFKLSTPFIIFPSNFRLTRSWESSKGSIFVIEFYEKSTILSCFNFEITLISSIILLLRLRIMTFSHSPRLSILEIPWPGRTIVNITAGENLFVIIFKIGMVILPSNQYLFFLQLVKSRNFQMLISAKFAPSSLELILFWSPVNLLVIYKYNENDIEIKDQKFCILFPYHEIS